MSLKDYLEGTFGKLIARKYEKRRLGGNNNQKGNSFEDEFAIHKAATLYCEGGSAQDTLLSGQAEDYVDDFVCDHESLSKRENYQLKDKKHVSWGGISEDFRTQQRINLEYHRRKTSNTYLIVSKLSLQRELSKKCPPSISTHSQCLHFKSEPFNSLLIAGDIQADPIKGLCAFPEEPDKVTKVWQALHGSWKRHQSHPISVKQLVLDAAEGYEPGYFKLGNATIPGPLKEILDKIEDINYSVEYGYLIYTVRGMLHGKLLIDSEEYRSFVENLSKEAANWKDFINALGRIDP